MNERWLDTGSMGFIRALRVRRFPRVLRTAGLTLGLGAVLTGCATAPAPADTVYLNGNVITVDKAFSIAQAVAIKDGVFVDVGTSDSVRRHVGANTRVVDLKGRTVIPGLMDSHTHLSGVGASLSMAPVFRARSVADAQAIIAEFIKSSNVPAGEWVRTTAWHPPSQLREQRYLTRQELDAVAPNHPLYAQTVGHFAMANSKALELAGIGKATPDPVGGKIFRDADGNATGLLEETAIELVTRRIPRPSADEIARHIVAGQRIFNQAGLTSAIDASVSEELMQVYFAVAERGLATMRTGLLLAAPVTGEPSAYEQRLKGAKYQDGTGNDWVRVAGIKIVADGGMTLKTAYTREGYADNPNNRGTLALDAQAYKRAVLAAHRNGWRVGTHAVGDGAIDLVLDAYEAAHQERSIQERRFVIIHGSLIARDQIERAKRLGVRVDAQNAFMWDKAATVERLMGPAVAQRAVPSRWLVDTLGFAGTAAGTDNPVNLVNPFVGLYIMVTRKDPTGKVFGAGQALTRQEALRLYTNAGPHYTFEERRKGSIEVGKLADMVVLSADYLAVPESQIKDIKPLATIVGGKVVFEQGN